MPTTYEGAAFALLRPSDPTPALNAAGVVVIPALMAGETKESYIARFGSVPSGDKLVASALLNLTDVTPPPTSGTLSAYMARAVPGPGTPRLLFPLMTAFFKPSFTVLANGNIRLQDTSGVTGSDIAFVVNGYFLPKTDGVLDYIVSPRQKITISKYRTSGSTGENYHRDSTQGDFNAILFDTELTPA